MTGTTSHACRQAAEQGQRGASHWLLWPPSLPWDCPYCAVGGRSLVVLGPSKSLPCIEARDYAMQGQLQGVRAKRQSCTLRILCQARQVRQLRHDWADIGPVTEPTPAHLQLDWQVLERCRATAHDPFHSGTVRQHACDSLSSAMLSVCLISHVSATVQETELAA